MLMFFIETSNGSNYMYHSLIKSNWNITKTFHLKNFRKKQPYFFLYAESEKECEIPDLVPRKVLKMAKGNS